jgi:hypothetical protein
MGELLPSMHKAPSFIPSTTNQTVTKVERPRNMARMENVMVLICLGNSKTHDTSLDALDLKILCIKETFYWVTHCSLWGQFL